MTKVLVPVDDLVSAGPTPVSAFFALLMARYPGITFLWPSRGPDLRLRRQGLLQPNAAPFAVDRSPELRRIAALIAADAHELPFAEQVVASAAALQGMVLDAVDVPSLAPVAHLIRPAFRAVGVGVRRVVECWLGSAAESGRHLWPEPAEERVDALEAMEARSAAAAELRYAAVVPAPLPGDGPSLTLPLTALFSPDRAETGPFDSGRFDSGRLAFAGFADGEGGIDRFIRLGAACSRPVALYCDLPGPHATFRRCLATEARRRGVELHLGAAPAGTCGVAPAATARFDPAPLQALLGGRPVALSRRSWTAAALRAEGAAELAPFWFDPLRSDAELAAGLEDMLADPAAVSLRPPQWAPPHITLDTVYGEAAARRRTGNPVELHPDVAAAALGQARPRRDAAPAPDVTVVVVADAANARGVAATLASVARQSEAMIEVVLVDDGSPDPDAVRNAADAAGGFVRLVRQGRAGPAAAMNRGLGEARAPIVCFLPAGCLAAPDLLATVTAPLCRKIEVGAAAPSWADTEAGWPGETVTPRALTRATAAATAASWSGPGLTVRRSAVLGVGGFDTTVDDWTSVDLLLRLQAQGDSVIPLSPPARAFKTVPAAGAGCDPASLLRVLSKPGLFPSLGPARSIA